MIRIEIDPNDPIEYTRAWCDEHKWISTNADFTPNYVRWLALQHLIDEHPEIIEDTEGRNPFNPNERN